MTPLLTVVTAGIFVSAICTVVLFAVSNRRAGVRHTLPEDPVLPSPSGRTRHRRQLVQASVAVLFLIVTASVAWGVQAGLSYCGAGIQRLNGECIGVTDGSYAFDVELASVESLIYRENVLVEHEGLPFVSIAFLAPMTRGSGTAGQLIPVLHELEGAYLAQQQVNQQRGPGPLVKLILANDGSTGQSWATVVRQLGGMVAGPERLVSVISVGNDSVTRTATRAVSALGLPVVSAASTSGGFDGQSVRGFASVAPSVSSEAAALVSFAVSRTHGPIMLISSDSEDMYSRSLADAIQQDIDAKRRVDTIETYAPGGSATNRIAQIAEEICAADVSTVFFAGQAADIESLISSLTAQVFCPGRQIAVFSGDTAAQAVLNSSSGAMANYVTLYSTALAVPSEWNSGVPSSQVPAAHAFHAFAASFESYFGPGTLDGQAMIAHDAVLAAAAAVKVASAASARPTAPTAGAVLLALDTLNGPLAVVGVTGVINLDPETGLPAGKPVAIVRMSQSGQANFVQLVVPPSDADAAFGG
jgi:hypothetical protein